MSSFSSFLLLHICNHFKNECSIFHNALAYDSLSPKIKKRIARAFFFLNDSKISSAKKLFYYNRSLFGDDSVMLDGILFCNTCLISFNPSNFSNQPAVAFYENIVSTLPVYTDIHHPQSKLHQVFVRLAHGPVIRLSTEADYSIYELDKLLCEIRNIIEYGNCFKRFYSLDNFIYFYQFRLVQDPQILHPITFNGMRLELFKQLYPLDLTETPYSLIPLKQDSIEYGILFTDIAIYFRLPNQPMLTIPYLDVVGHEPSHQKYGSIIVSLASSKDCIIPDLSKIFSTHFVFNTRYINEMLEDILNHHSIFCLPDETQAAN